MPVIPFAFQWSIPENELISFRDSGYGCLKTDNVSNIPGLKYCLWMSPNGDKDGKGGETYITLYLNHGDIEKVKADYTFLIKSADFFFKKQDTFEKSNDCGFFPICIEDFFKPEKKFIANGKCIIKVYGTFKFETSDAPNSSAEQQKWDGGELGNELWKKEDNKDFTIVVEGRKIKAHKFILGSRSQVFSATFNDSKQNVFEVKNFSFDVVETAVKMIYNCDCATSLSVDDLMSLLHFFDKYNIPSLKDKVEPLLINQISAATVCRLTNCSILTNSPNLKKKCMEFLMDSFASKTYLSDILTLDKNVALEILHNSLFKIVETQ